jgi:acyl-CoA synthetase (NDP forming)
VVTADLCQQSGLDVPALDDAVIAKIDPYLPPYWSRTNPVDMVGEPNPEAAIAILELLMAWEGCDAVINLGMLGRRLFMERFGAAVEKADPTISKHDIENRSQYLDKFEQRFLENGVRLMGQHQKPLIGVSLLSDSRQKTVSRFGDASHKAVCFETPERAVNALAAMVRYKQFIDLV